MTSLSELLFASLLLRSRRPEDDRRGGVFDDIRLDSEDLRAARERARTGRRS